MTSERALAQQKIIGKKKNILEMIGTYSNDDGDHWFRKQKRPWQDHQGTNGSPRGASNGQKHARPRPQLHPYEGTAEGQRFEKVADHGASMEIGS